MEQKTSAICKVIYILLNASSWPFAGLAPLCHCLSCPEEPAWKTDMAHQGIIERKDDLSQPPGNPLPNVAQDTVGLCCCKDTSLADGQHGVHQGLLRKAALQPGHGGAWLCSFQGQDLVCAFFEVLEVPTGPFFQPVKAPLN